MASTPLVTIDATGIHMPAEADVQAFFQAAFRGIYGQDVYLGNDCQDGQWVQLIAGAFHDANAVAVAVYNSFSPASAQKVGLDRIVKINGLTRSGATRSSVDLRLIGQAGATITGGIAADGSGTQWVLPTLVTFPLAGEITVTATAADLGAIAATAGTITSIATPTFGWQSVTNPAAATPGLPVESDAALRQRQTLSTTLAARTLLEGVAGTIAAMEGVARFRVFENDLDQTDDNGLPGHSIAFVVDGGDAQMIAALIAARKGPGVSTYGTTKVTTGDRLGIARAIAFSRPVAVPVAYGVSLKALKGYNLEVQAKIAQALTDWTVGLGIGGGQDGALLLTRAYGPALLRGDPAERTFEILSLSVGRDSQPLGQGDLPFRFDEAPTCDPASIFFTVTQ